MSVPHLTSPQEECVRLLAQGKTAKQIAKELNKTESTIRSHLFSAYKKLEVVNSAQAVAKYLSSGGSVPSNVNQARVRLTRLASLADKQGNHKVATELLSIANLLL